MHTALAQAIRMSSAAAAAGKQEANISRSKRAKDAMSMAPFGTSNSADVPTKLGPAAALQDARRQRLGGTMAALRQAMELKEQQRVAAIKKKLLAFDGYCWCCLAPGCTHEPGSKDCPQYETVVPDMSDFAELKPPQTRSAKIACRARGHAQLAVMTEGRVAGGGWWT